MKTTWLNSKIYLALAVEHQHGVGVYQAYHAQQQVLVEIALIRPRGLKLGVDFFFQGN